MIGRGMVGRGSGIGGFGQYTILNEFQYDLLSLTSDRLLRWGGTIKPSDPRYVQPDKNVCIPFDLWLEGKARSGKRTNQMFKDNFRDYCWNISEAFVNGELKGTEVFYAIEDYVYTMVSKWPQK